MCFLKWRNKAKIFTKDLRQREEERKKKIKDENNAERLDELDKNILDQKDAVIHKQVESLLYSAAIDCINGFINL